MYFQEDRGERNGFCFRLVANSFRSFNSTPKRTSLETFLPCLAVLAEEYTTQLKVTPMAKKAT